MYVHEKPPQGNSLFDYIIDLGNMPIVLECLSLSDYNKKYNVKMNRQGQKDDER